MPDFAVTIYAGFVGLTAAGFMGSCWALLTRRPPSFSLVRARNLVFPAAFLTILVHAPVMLWACAVSQGRAHPWRSAAIMVIALLWSFIQGVFILRISSASGRS